MAKKQKTVAPQLNVPPRKLTHNRAGGVLTEKQREVARRYWGMWGGKKRAD